MSFQLLHSTNVGGKINVDGNNQCEPLSLSCKTGNIVGPRPQVFL